MHDGSGAGPERSPTSFSQEELNSVKPVVLGSSYKSSSTVSNNDEIESNVQDASGASYECLSTSCDNKLESVDEDVMELSHECSSTFDVCD